MNRKRAAADGRGPGGAAKVANRRTDKLESAGSAEVNTERERHTHRDTYYSTRSRERGTPLSVRLGRMRECARVSMLDSVHEDYLDYHSS